MPGSFPCGSRSSVTQSGECLQATAYGMRSSEPGITGLRNAGGKAQRTGGL